MNKQLHILIGLALAVHFASASAQKLTLRNTDVLRPAAKTESQGPEQSDYIVAVVNSEPLTYREVLLQTMRAEQRLTMQGMPIASRSELFSEVLEKAINERILVQQALDTGIKLDDATIDDAMTSIAAQNGLTLDQLIQRLRNDGMAIGKFRSDLRDEILVGRIKERDFESRVRASDADVQEFIQQQSQSTDSSHVEVNMAQILVELPDDADTQAIAKARQVAESLRERLLNGEDFAKLALQYSQATGKNQGSAMGLKNASRYPEVFIRAVQNLGAGKISAVIQTNAGFHILKLLEKKQAGLPSMVVEQTHARHILIKPTAQTSESAARQKLLDIRSQILAKTATFEDMARQYSQDGSAQEGGDLGWASPGQFVPEFETAMNQLPEGAVSEPITSRYGVHLIQAVGRKTYTMSDTEQREMVRSIVKERKLQEQYPQWLQELRASAYVEYRQPPQN